MVELGEGFGLPPFFRNMRYGIRLTKRSKTAVVAEALYRIHRDGHVVPDDVKGEWVNES
jgi:hypothetical protein